ncbi:uncharacterized protein [Dermacentor andersoni]|uniref:uncharacterized protein n=1 Tax=Dermacentor andersoni TaxID=34620 RepID=UPI003B3B0C7A
MKLIRWVEVHIGRSRKRSKKTPTKQQASPQCSFPSDKCISPLHTTAEGEGTSHLGCHARLEVEPRTSNLPKLSVHIRTSFLGQTSPADARQRSGIKTNPWIASSRSPCGSSSADSGWAGSHSSTGSEGDYGDMSLLLPPREPRDHWSSMGSLRSRAPCDSSIQGGSPLRLRTSWALDRRPSPLTGSSDLCLTTQLPESARQQRGETCIARRALTGTRISDSSDDEAYSEDFLQSEGSSDAVTVVKAGTPQTDSACDPGSSCTTTPLSECSSQLQTTETFADKVRRLQAQRVVVEQKIHEARIEEQASRDQRIQLHRELMHFRRLTLLHSLQELRSDLEQRTASETAHGGRH